MIIGRAIMPALVMFAGIIASVTASEINGFAALGASETAGPASDYTGSWVPYFVIQRGLNFGGTGNPYNVAVGGATSATLLTQGQHTKVAGFVENGDVDVAYLSIGGNDFSLVGGQIASGALTGTALTAWAQGVVDNVTTAMDTVLASNPQGMIVAGMPNIPLTPVGRFSFSAPAAFARGEAAIDEYDSLLRPAVLSRGFAFVDLAGAMYALNGGPLYVGGVLIDTFTAGTDPTHLFQDGKHPAAVGNGLIANIFLEAANIAFGADYPLLTDLEILTAAGLAGSYTGETSHLPYADLIVFHWGDANGDTFVDGGDYTIWADHYLQTGQGWSAGDFTRNGVVDGGDYTVWADHYSPSPATAATAVPEPSTSALVSIATLVGLLRCLRDGRRSPT